MWLVTTANRKHGWHHKYVIVAAASLFLREAREEIVFEAVYGGIEEKWRIYAGRIHEMA